MCIDRTFSIKQYAKNLGFSACGVAKAETLPDDKVYFEDYLRRGDFGEMSYLTRNLDKRSDPALVMEHTKSIIVVLWDYSGYTSQETPEGKIAKYACGEDYHRLIKTKLHDLGNEIRTFFPAAKMRSFVDTAPILEKAWAIKAGLGFRGKNTLLIHPEIGSYCNIGVILLDQELTYDTPLDDGCGVCLRCVNSCPNGALMPYQLDARKCIAHYNTEKQCTSRVDLHGWGKGCDLCQGGCPYNS
ncbi:MAG: tRNA epoxyqueuosine(34) reductase QueG [Bacteroidales bacterium]|jgi:epoxyqueuosine reductase|nr:tRNA epoxyqueuosine(34) reductase QueG [Bacteroidales bacterium]